MVNKFREDVMATFRESLEKEEIEFTNDEKCIISQGETDKVKFKYKFSKTGRIILTPISKKGKVTEERFAEQVSWI